MKPVYLVIGVPSSGKSWIASQLTSFTYVHHDGYIGHINQPRVYVKEIVKQAMVSDKPILAEAPFSISQIKDPLEARGIKVIPVFIIEDHKVLNDRYWERERKPIPQGHLTRQQTYKKRATEWKSFMGTSSECLEFLRGVK